MRHVNLSSGNDITLLHCGAEYFPAMIAAFDAARYEIWLETYIFAADATANRVRDALIDAARRGVEVRVITDWHGTGPWQTAALDEAFPPPASSIGHSTRGFARGSAARIANCAWWMGLLLSSAA